MARYINADELLKSMQRRYDEICDTYGYHDLYASGYDDAVDAVENAPTADVAPRAEWISVEERLPEECKAVLCFAGNKIVLAFMEKTEDCGEYVPVFWDLVAYDRDDTWDEVCATHWMPLPDPPKGE